MKKSQLRKIIREIIEEQASSNYLTSTEGEQLPLCVGYDNFIFGAVETASGFSHNTLLDMCNNLYISPDVFNNYTQDQINATTFCCSLMPGVTFTPEQSADIPTTNVPQSLSPTSPPLPKPRPTIKTPGAPQPKDFRGGDSGKDYMIAKNAFIKKMRIRK